MCAPRKSLINLLQTEFQKDAHLAKECLESAQDKVKSGLATRFFNQFPCLIPTNELILLTHELRRIVVCVDPDSIIENKKTFVLTDEDDKDDIFEWQMKIISYAASALLDEKSRINNELLQFFELHQIEIDPWEIMCALIANINEHIILQFEKQFKQTMVDHKFVFDMIFMYANRYGKWTRTFLDLHNEMLDTDNEHFMKPLRDIIQKLNQSSRKVYALRDEDKSQIREWQQNMINEIMDKLIDEKGQIEEKYLTQYSSDNKINPNEIIYMYLDILNNHIVESQKTLLDKNSHHAELILDYIKLHKGSWIKDLLPNKGYVVVAPKIDFAKVDYQSPSVLLVLGTALTTTVTVSYAGYMFFKNAKEANKIDAEKNNRKTLVV